MNNYSGVMILGAKERFYYYITALHSEVTGSCLFVNVNYPDGRKTKFLVDCGLFQEANYSYLNNEKFPFNADEIEFVLITHNHADHIGRLPMLSKEGFRGPIYSVAATSNLLPIPMKNSFQIMGDDAKKRNKKPLYTESDVARVLKDNIPCELEKTVHVNENISITFLDNGHLVTAAMVHVRISFPGYEDILILFTGDYKAKNVFKEVREIPKEIRELPTAVVTEATYGYMETKDVSRRFEQDVQKILQDGKSLVIFISAQERAQEVSYYLKMMQDSGKISKEIPIYSDGNLSQIYTKMYLNGVLGIDEGKRNFIPMNFNLVTKDNRDAVIQEKRQKIILTTSGMADHGPAPIYISEYISRTDYAFYFTVYMAKGSLGYQLQNSKDGKVSIRGKEREIKAQVFSTNEFSSHAKADELEELLKKFTNLTLVLINHGVKEVKELFKQRIEDTKIVKRVEVLGEHTVKVSHYGCVKTMGAKLYETAKKPKMKRKKSNRKQKIGGYKRRK